MQQNVFEPPKVFIFFFIILILMKKKDKNKDRNKKKKKKKSPMKLLFKRQRLNDEIQIFFF